MVFRCFYPPKVYIYLIIIFHCVVWWLAFGLILGPYNSISQVRRGSALFASTQLYSWASQIRITQQNVHMQIYVACVYSSGMEWWLIYVEDGKAGLIGSHQHRERS